MNNFEAFIAAYNDSEFDKASIFILKEINENVLTPSTQMPNEALPDILRLVEGFDYLAVPRNEINFSSACHKICNWFLTGGVNPLNN